MARTYNELYLDARKRLKRGGIEAYELEAKELVCYAAGKSREELYSDMRLYVSTELEARVEELLDRRMGGEPAAYIVGEWDFYGLSLDINRNVLIPRADTEVVAERAIALAKAKAGSCRVLDLCAGSGCIGLAIASQVPETFVVLADVSEEAIHVCRQNSRRHHLGKRTVCVCADALEAPPASLSGFDLIVSNPPYIPSGDINGLDRSVKDFEPHLALDGGEDGLDFYRSIAAHWQRALRPGGTLLVEVGIHQADAVERLLAQEGFQNINTLADHHNIWRAVEGTLPG